MAAVADELVAEHLVGALSGACGGLSATALFPFDLVKTRMQAGVGAKANPAKVWATFERHRTKIHSACSHFG